VRVVAIRRGKAGGRIVNVAALQALGPRNGAKISASTAAKAAVAAVTAALGEELAGEGILVSAVASSIMDTPNNRRNMPKANFDAWPSGGRGGGDPFPRLAREQGEPGRRGPGFRASSAL
jgi:NAD(P)-dependent dehydrogenase (short-subunit alcohol dehydrogenase family)